MQYSTVQYSTVQYSTADRAVQYRTVQYTTVQFNTSIVQNGEQQSVLESGCPVIGKVSSHKAGERKHGR